MVDEVKEVIQIVVKAVKEKRRKLITAQEEQKAEKRRAEKAKKNVEEATATAMKSFAMKSVAPSGCTIKLENQGEEGYPKKRRISSFDRQVGVKLEKPLTPEHHVTITEDVPKEHQRQRVSTRVEKRAENRYDKKKKAKKSVHENAIRGGKESFAEESVPCTIKVENQGEREYTKKRHVSFDSQIRVKSEDKLMPERCVTKIQDVPKPSRERKWQRIIGHEKQKAEKRDDGDGTKKAKKRVYEQATEGGKKSFAEKSVGCTIKVENQGERGYPKTRSRISFDGQVRVKSEEISTPERRATTIQEDPKPWEERKWQRIIGHEKQKAEKRDDGDGTKKAKKRVHEQGTGGANKSLAESVGCTIKVENQGERGYPKTRSRISFDGQVRVKSEEISTPERRVTTMVPNPVPTKRQQRVTAQEKQKAEKMGKRKEEKSVHKKETPTRVENQRERGYPKKRRIDFDGQVRVKSGEILTPERRVTTIQEVPNPAHNKQQQRVTAQEKQKAEKMGKRKEKKSVHNEPKPTRVENQGERGYPKKLRTSFDNQVDVKSAEILTPERRVTITDLDARGRCLKWYTPYKIEEEDKVKEKPVPMVLKPLIKMTIYMVAEKDENDVQHNVPPKRENQEQDLQDIDAPIPSASLDFGINDILIEYQEGRHFNLFESG